MLHGGQPHVALKLRNMAVRWPPILGAMAREIGSWLSGPEPVESGDNKYPGQALGLPKSGSRSLAGFGRRLLALTVDWLIGYGLASLAMTAGYVTTATLSTAVLLVWLVLGIVSVRLFGFTPGQYALGLMVVPIDNRIHVGLGRAVARGLLIALAVPALFTDIDGRGVQDRLTYTAVVRR